MQKKIKITLFILLALFFISGCNNKGKEKINSNTTFDEDVVEHETLYKTDQDSPKDFCASSPCSNNSECKNLKTTYKCECLPGFSGKNCEKYDPLTIVIKMTKEDFKRNYAETIFFSEEGDFHYSIDCDNDGIFEKIINYNEGFCEFNHPGEYTIKIVGEFPKIEISPCKNIDIKHWGNIKWKTMKNAFSFCKNLTFSAKDTPNLSEVTDISYMFSYTENFNSNINNWDVSNVKYMIGVFDGAKDFNQPLNNWDVSNVLYMNSMFSSATNFNQPLDKWNVSNVINMSKMFFLAKNFNQPLNNWNISNVVYMDSMFRNATSFNQPLNKWDVSNVENMNSMFDNAINFNQPLNNWDVSNVRKMSFMFDGAKKFNQSLGNWNISMVSELFFMLCSTNLSTLNYDDTLIGWASLSLQYDLSFDTTGLTYCRAKNARYRIIEKFGWKIENDKFVNCLAN